LIASTWWLDSSEYSAGNVTWKDLLNTSKSLVIAANCPIKNEQSCIYAGKSPKSGDGWNQVMSLR
jgi:hypothetical protein